ncbi:MAG TPA: DNA-binding protein [Candidatus Avipropionibacterium avicola]|uniref:DNA-binding protein n=1 Tax=Candidatus Avipropionibacterium avicola TaxID=2840701 RepID=A0A9D1KLA1_9ACTN|nr:DNA-binding protein [Candidatus Avipropionibacterium avicola]
MTRKPSGNGPEQQAADAEQQAREHLAGIGATAIGPQPWRPSPMPATATDLVQYAVWRSADLSAEDLVQAASLLPAARAEVDGLEAGLLFAARSAGATWAELAEAMGFNSPQACQQHFARLNERASR